MDFSKLPPGGSININFEEYNEEASNQKNKKQNLQSSHNQDQVARFEGIRHQCPHPEQFKHMFQRKPNQIKELIPAEAIQQTIRNSQQQNEVLRQEQERVTNVSGRGRGKRKNTMFSQENSRNVNNEMMIPATKIFTVVPHLASCYKNNHRVESHIDIDIDYDQNYFDVTRESQQTGTSLTHAAEKTVQDDETTHVVNSSDGQNLRVITTTTTAHKQNVSAYSDTYLYEDDVVSNWLFSEDVPSLDHVLRDTSIRGLVPDPNLTSGNHVSTVDKDVVHVLNSASGNHVAVIDKDVVPDPNPASGNHVSTIDKDVLSDPNIASGNHRIAIVDEDIVRDPNLSFGNCIATVDEDIVRDPNLASANHIATNYEDVVPIASDKDVSAFDIAVFGGCLPHPIGMAMESEKKVITETAYNALEELTRMIKLNEPFWFSSTKTGKFILQRETYDNFYKKISVLNGPDARIEASKESLVVSMAGAQLVDMFLDSKKWIALFPTIVKTACTIQVFEHGLPESRDGAMQLMHAKMHILSPLVPTRHTSFLRCCKQIDKDIWVIADVSSLSIRSIFDACIQNVWKFPSGCMIQKLTNDSCRVTWVEHIQVDDKRTTDTFFEKPVCGNNGYRAERWVLTMERMCQRISTSLVPNTSSTDITTRAKRIVMKLAERMLKIFYEALDMASNTDFPKLNTMDSDGVRVCVRKCTDPGTENGVILTASLTFWLSCSPDHVFDFFKDSSRRFQWDVLCEGYPTEEIHRITNGTNPGNFTSIIKTLNVKDEDMRILQECYTHSMESGLVYCPIDTNTMNCAIRGEDCSMLPLLPSGLTISGDGRLSDQNIGKVIGEWYEGSIVTLTYQMLIGKDSKMNSPDLNVLKKINKFVNSAVNKIRDALNCSDY
ncbi:homeobox-leucine zipper protein HDG8 isoform X1 [Lathyrus oleraceus]|nr:homeobox-leucine zipper protein HDG8-like isoform X1 [Pisum sativum]